MLWLTNCQITLECLCEIPVYPIHDKQSELLLINLTILK